MNSLVLFVALLPALVLGLPFLNMPAFPAAFMATIRRTIMRNGTSIRVSYSKISHDQSNERQKVLDLSLGSLENMMASLTGQ